MTKLKKLSFAEGISKLSRAHFDKLQNSTLHQFKNNEKSLSKKKVKVKKIFNEFIWISNYERPTKINFNLNRNDLEACFTIESYNFSSGNSKTKFLLSGFTMRRPWLLWKEDWDSHTDNFINLQPILGMSKKDTSVDKVAVIELLKCYVNRINYQIQASYVHDSDLISRKNILEIINSHN
jgi:hypothetical protein